ncbi:MAG: hypothetical protein KKF67_01785 [Nanoarchaeota archaeon]|nr:hypothetical protein [Nanoarchaeota archaeon]
MQKEFELRTDYCKDFLEINRFFQELINDGFIRAYDFEINKTTSEEHQGMITMKIIKGVSLSPTTEIKKSSDSPFFFQRTGFPNFYTCERNIRISNSDFEDLESRYGFLTIKRLIDKVALRKFEGSFHSLDAPKNFVNGYMIYSWEHKIRDREDNKYRAYLRIGGVHDSVFGKVKDFLANGN